MDLILFNPNAQNEADFLKGFVARQDILTFLLNQLRQLPEGQAARHHLMVAPRGFGKTSLLRRTAIGIREAPELMARFVPLRFREEQHNVISLDVFWRNCLHALLEAREDEGAPADELDRLDALWERHSPRHLEARTQQDGGPAWDALQQECQRLGRRAVLLIDNLDTLLAGLTEAHQWALRKCLQQDDGPVMLAAASRYPESIHQHQAPFFDFFRIQPLDRLDNAEVMACLKHIAQQRGTSGTPVLQLLRHEPGRIAALNTLAGGNPRTLSVLYRVLESHMSADVLSQLSAMLDTFTGWYQARTEELALQTRAVFDALALNWNPMTAAKLSEVTGLDTAAVSSHLSRLEKSGHVEAVSLTSHRKGRKGYQVAERFYNIWYLMRNGPRRARQSIRFLTSFMQTCYSPAERRRLAQKTLNEGKAEPEYALALASMLRPGPLRQRLIDHATNLTQASGQADVYRELIADLQADARAPVVRDGPHGIVPDHVQARALMREGLAAENAGRPRVALARYQAVREQFGQSHDAMALEEVAWAYRLSIALHSRLRQHRQVLALSEEFIARLGESTDPVHQRHLTRARLNRAAAQASLGRWRLAVQDLQALLGPDDGGAAGALNEDTIRAGTLLAQVLADHGQRPAALDTYRRLIGRFAANQDSPLALQVMRARLALARLLADGGDTPEALDVLTQAAQIATERRETDAQTWIEWWAVALLSRAQLLQEAEEWAASREHLAPVIRDLAGTAERAWQTQWAWALTFEGKALSMLGLTQDSIASQQRLLDALGASEDKDIVRRLISARLLQAECELELGHTDAAALATDQAEALCERLPPGERALQQIWVALQRSDVWIERGQLEAAEHCLEEGIHRCAELEDRQSMEMRALCHAGLADLMERQQRWQGAIDQWQRVIELDATSIEPRLAQASLLADPAGQAHEAATVLEVTLTLHMPEAHRAAAHRLLGQLQALALGQPEAARPHLTAAMAIAPQPLDGVILALATPTPDWPRVFDELVRALDVPEAMALDNGLHRILAHLKHQGQACALADWMRAHGAHQRQALLHGALLAMALGDDHLMTLNPETREAAQALLRSVPSWRPPKTHAKP